MNALRIVIAIAAVIPAIALACVGAVLIICAEPFIWVATKALEVFDEH